MFDDKKIILASRSPRRQMILTEAGIDFIVKPLDVLESYRSTVPIDEVPRYIAKKKTKPSIEY